MVISHRYKFIFIKTRKTVGTSVEAYLSQLCGDKDVLTPIYPSVEGHRPQNYQGRWNPTKGLVLGESVGGMQTVKDWMKKRKFNHHQEANVIQKRVPKRIWETYLKFCIEINPWDKTLSHYYMVKARARNELTLDEYLSRGEFCLNYPLYTDNNGKVIVDKVLSYEHLNRNPSETFGLLNVPFSGTLDVHAKSRYRTDRRTYKDVLTIKQRDIIKSAFLKEIDLHGYVY